MIKAHEIALHERPYITMADLRNGKRRIISHSQRNTFIDCRQKFYFRYICGIIAKMAGMSDPLKGGKIWDAIVPYLYRRSDHWENAFWNAVEESEAGKYIWPKVYGLAVAYNELGMRPIGERFEEQKEFKLTTPISEVRGFVDVHFTDHFEEHKLGASDRYYTMAKMEAQLSTYFMSYPYEYAVIKVAKRPALRYKDGETEMDYVNKLVGDIKKRPSFYFMGYNHKRKDYGLGINQKIYRTEFDLKSAEEDFDLVTLDMIRCMDEGSFYPDKNKCDAPFECEYKSICEHRVVSRELYDVKEVA